MSEVAEYAESYFHNANAEDYYPYSLMAPRSRGTVYTIHSLAYS
jgi:hypothetical protein